PRRIAEVDLRPVLPERVELLGDELCRRRVDREVVRGREEKTLERITLAPEPRLTARKPRDREEGAARERRGPAPFALGDLRDRGHAPGHLRARKTLREDDLERPRRKRGRRRLLTLPAAAEAAHDRPGDRESRDQHAQ